MIIIIKKYLSKFIYGCDYSEWLKFKDNHNNPYMTRYLDALRIIDIHESRHGEKIIVDSGIPEACFMDGIIDIKEARKPSIIVIKIPTKEYLNRYKKYKVIIKQGEE